MSGGGGRSRGATVVGEERLTGGRVVVVLKLDLLEEEVGTGTHEGVRLGGEHRLDVAVLGFQSAEEVQHLAGLGDGMTNVAQFVGELLQLGAVGVDAEIALDDAAEVSLKDNSTVHLVVAEETFDVRPDGERGGIGIVDEVEDTLVESCVEPVDDGVVDLTPFGVTIGKGRRRTNVAEETELAKNRLQEAAPLTVVGVKEIEENRDVVADVHRLNHGEGGRLGNVEEVGSIRGGGGARRRVCHGGAGGKRKRVSRIRR